MCVVNRLFAVLEPNIPCACDGKIIPPGIERIDCINAWTCKAYVLEWCCDAYDVTDTNARNACLQESRCSGTQSRRE